jgi:citrate/tricarballylate utilization protein
MELRRSFSDQELNYLANLCHNCRDCYYACQYAPPHEYDVNVPKTLAELRYGTYVESAAPGFFKTFFTNSGFIVPLINLLSIGLVFLLVFAINNVGSIWGTHSGPNSFYQVIPYTLIVLPMVGLVSALIVGMLLSFRKFWRLTGGRSADLLTIKAHLQAVSDAVTLKYLAGGGHGCNYPSERFSMIRRKFHHATFYGFMLCFAATAVAAIYDHWLHIPAPYPLFSLPVMLGTVGGILILIGTPGLLFLKLTMDKIPASPGNYALDIGFIVTLFLTSLTGLLLLALRSTPWMGTMLIIHIGVVVALFITMPYGKFVHGIYRYAALLRNSIEQSRGKV